VSPFFVGIVIARYEAILKCWPKN